MTGRRFAPDRESINTVIARVCSARSNLLDIILRAISIAIRFLVHPDRRIPDPIPFQFLEVEKGFTCYLKSE
jgi:hypothetical protein